MPTMRGQHHPFFDGEQLFLKQPKLYDVENCTPLMGLEPTARDYMPSVMTTELWECGIFQFMFLDTDSGDIDICVCKS